MTSTTDFREGRRKKEEGRRQKSQILNPKSKMECSPFALRILTTDDTDITDELAY
jgi:hypothetical protein